MESLYSVVSLMYTFLLYWICFFIRFDNYKLTFIDIDLLLMFAWICGIYAVSESPLRFLRIFIFLQKWHTFKKMCLSMCSCVHLLTSKNVFLLFSFQKRRGFMWPHLTMTMIKTVFLGIVCLFEVIPDNLLRDNMMRVILGILIGRLNLLNSNEFLL